MSLITRRPPGLRTRAASSIACRRPSGSLMLWMASALRTTSKEPCSNGIRVMSPVRRSTRSPTPSRSALCRAASMVLPDWSADFQRSMPTALGKQLGGHKEHRAASGAHVQDALVATQPQATQELCPDGELPRAGREDVDGGAEQHEEAPQQREQEPATGAPEGGGEERDHEQTHPGGSEDRWDHGGVEAVVGLSVRQVRQA